MATRLRTPARTADTARGGTMTGEVLVRRPLVEVFAFVADMRNEPRYNRRMASAEKVTPGPVGTGTCFHQRMRMPGRSAHMSSEITGYDPLRSLAVRAHLTWMDTSGALTFAPAEGGTRLSWDWDVRLHGRAAALAPVLLVLGRRQERATWRALARYLERQNRWRRRRRQKPRWRSLAGQ